jgi:predicted RNA polymerase sigma factor
MPAAVVAQLLQNQGQDARDVRSKLLLHCCHLFLQVCQLVAATLQIINTILQVPNRHCLFAVPGREML